MKNDLRYQETERQLMDAFARAIVERPLDRITVTGLVSDAGLSKATFYLHYHDVRDLAETFAGDFARDQAAALSCPADPAVDPRGFAQAFADDLARDNGIVSALIESGLESIYLDELVDALLERLGSPYAEPAEADGRSRTQYEMALRFTLHGLASLSLRYGEDPAERADLIEVAARILAAALG